MVKGPLTIFHAVQIIAHVKARHDELTAKTYFT